MTLTSRSPVQGMGIFASAVADMPMAATKTPSPRASRFNLMREIDIVRTSSSAELRGDLLASLDQSLHRLDGLHEGRALAAVEVDFHHALDATGSDDHGHADIEPLDA